MASNPASIRATLRAWQTSDDPITGLSGSSRHAAATQPPNEGSPQHSIHAQFGTSNRRRLEARTVGVSSISRPFGFHQRSRIDAGVEHLRIKHQQLTTAFRPK